MTRVENVKSGMDLLYLSNTYILDGKCVKSRHSDCNIDKEEIQKRIDDFDNIVIQNNDKIDIYCDIGFLEKFRNFIVDYFENKRNREDSIFKMYEAGLVELHVNPDYISQII